MFKTLYMMDKPLEDMLYDSVLRRDRIGISKLLQRGANPNKVTRHGKTCLTEAAYIGHINIVELLIDACKSTSVQNKSPQNSSKKTYWKSHRTNPRAKGYQDETVMRCKNVNDMTLKGTTSNENFSRSRGSHQSEHNQGYFVCIHNEGSRSNECKKSIKSPVSPTTPVSTQAELEWDEEIVDVAPSTSEDETWSSMYEWYATILESTGEAIASTTIVSNGIDQHDKFMRTALHYAADQGHAQIVKLLLDEGGKVDVATGDGFTALHIAVIKDHNNLALQLLEAGSAVNYKTHEKMTPLHYAATRGNLGLVKILVSHGAYLEARDTNERTPLYFAAGKGHLEVVKFFISYGANVNGEQSHGYTPLCEAVWGRFAQVVQLLLANGARITHSHKLLHNAIFHREAEIVKMLANVGCGINLHNEAGDTPLLLSVRLTQPEIALMLLERGANANAYNSLTWANALHIAVETVDYTYQFEYLLISLLDFKIDLNFTARTGDTALTRALLLHKDTAAIMLIRHGADVNICDLQTCGLDNLLITCKRTTNQLAKLLLRAGHRYPASNFENHLVLQNDTISWLVDYCKHPRSLTDICRIQIRKNCKHMLLCRYIGSLCLPKSLKKFLMLETED